MTPAPSRAVRWFSWLFGIAALSAVVIVARHFSEATDFALLAERTEPWWLLLAVVLQAPTDRRGREAPAARADELRAPQNVDAEVGNRQSSDLSSEAATADMRGRPQQAVEQANQGIRADPRNPRPYYDKGMALAQLGDTDGALAALAAAEQRFAPTDRWGKSIAIYGRAHTLSEAGRCTEAVQAFTDYAKFVEKDDPQGAAMARRYAMDCQPGRAAAPAAPAPNR